MHFHLYTLTLSTENHVEPIYNFEGGGQYFPSEEAVISEANAYEPDTPEDEPVLIMRKLKIELTEDQALDLADLEWEDMEEEGKTWEDVLEEAKDNVVTNYGRRDIDIAEYLNVDELDLEVEELVVREIQRVNADSDFIMRKVMDLLGHKLGYNSSARKYQDAFVSENGRLSSNPSGPNGQDRRRVTIRIADHTHNPRNGHNDLNVVISNHDATEDHFDTATTHLRYNTEDIEEGEEDDFVEEIVEDILSYFKDDDMNGLDGREDAINKLRSDINRQLGQVSCPCIMKAVQTPEGYADVESRVAEMCIRYRIAPSAVLPQLESEFAEAEALDDDAVDDDA